MEKTRKFRLTLGGMLVVVALAALAINALRPETTKIVDLKVGTGPVVKIGDMVTVHYVGTLGNGKVFDSSKDRGQPFDVVIGRGTVIRGWDVGVEGMQAGGVRRLVIPSGEAYGAKGMPPVIPPNSALSFEIELIGIK